MADYLDVFILCSDPVNLRPTLNLGQELAAFERIVRDSEWPVRLRKIVPPTLEQLEREFSLAGQRGERPAVFHFLGHGDDDGLYFEDEHGRAELVKGSQLRQALANSPVKVALLNACWSATSRGVSLCEFLTREQVAQCAIGHQRPVADSSAIEFAHQFYTLATTGKSVREAQQRARNSLAEKRLMGASEVELVGDGEFLLTADPVRNAARPPQFEGGQPKLGSVDDVGIFFGRGDELIELSEAFADSKFAAFGLWGIGGIGKTALAKTAAARNVWRFQGVAFVDVRDAAQKTTAELLRLALNRLFPGAPDNDPAFELAKRLKEAPSLLVLDNLEDLPAEEHAALGRFIEKIPRNGSHLLLTARVPLAAIERLPGVRTRRLTQGLDDWNGAHYVQHVAEVKECLALKDELRLREGNRLEGRCVLVNQRLHGHPKMLELSVGRALQGQAALDEALVALPEEMEQQFAALLATYLAHLGQEGRQVLSLLQFFPTGRVTPEELSAAAAASLEATAENRTDPSDLTDPSDESPAPVSTRDPDADVDSPEPDLTWLHRGRQQLVGAGLLEYDQASDLFEFHQSILDESRRRNLEGPARRMIFVRLLGHYANYFQQYHNDYDRLDRCFGNAITLMEGLWQMRSEAGPVDGILAGMTDSMGNYLLQRGRWQLKERWHERAVELRETSSHAKNDAALALQKYQQAQVMAARGDNSGARSALIEAQEFCERSGDQQGLAASLHQLANLEFQAGSHAEAQQLWERSIKIDTEIGDIAGASTTRSMLAQVEAMAGNFQRAITLASQSVQDLERLGYAQVDQARSILASIQQLASGGAVPAAGNAGLLQRFQTELARWSALSGSERQQQLVQLAATSDRVAAALTWLAHSVVCFQQRELPECQAALAQAEAIAAEVNDAELTSLIATAREQLAAAAPSASSAPDELSAAMRHIKAGDFAAADGLLRQALATARNAGEPVGVATCLFLLGQVEYLQGKAGDAVAALREALELATQANEVDLVKEIQKVLTVAVHGK